MPFFKKKKKDKSAAVDASKRLPPDMVYSMTPRHGHSQDVFDENNIRQVAGCLPIDPINKRFLLVTSSTNPGNWVIPKGGWEKDETQEQAAMRETWEEAGVKGVITRHIGVFAEKSKGVVKAHHWIYEMEIIEVTKKFPEQRKRERRWFTYEEAKLVVKASYILDALSMSSLSPISGTDCETLQNGEKKKEKKKKKKPVEEDEESSEEDAEEKRKKKERKKQKKKEKKERKLREAEEAELSDVDENGTVLTDEQKKERRRTRIEEATAALARETDSEEEEEEEKKKKKKKKGKKGEISELKEEEMLFTSSLDTKNNLNLESKYEPIVQQFQQTHISPPQRSPQSLPPQSPPQMRPTQISPQIRPTQVSPQIRPSQLAAQRGSPSLLPQQQRSPPPTSSQFPQHQRPMMPQQRPQQPGHYTPQSHPIPQGQRPMYMQHSSQPGPRQPGYSQPSSPPQQRQPMFPQQPQVRQPMYSQQQGMPPQQQRQPMFPPQGPMYGGTQRPSNYPTQSQYLPRQGKHHVVEDSF